MTMTGTEAERLEGREDFAAVYQRHHARAVGLAFLLCGDADVAADLVADAWVGVYRRLGRGAIVDVGPYLRRAVVNAIRSHARRAALARRLIFFNTGHPGHAPDAAGAVDNRMVMQHALARLPARMRTAVVLRYYDDRSVEQTAALMGISPGTIKSTTSKGLAKLRHLLEEPT